MTALDASNGRGSATAKSVHFGSQPDRVSPSPRTWSTAHLSRHETGRAQQRVARRSNRSGWRTGPGICRASCPAVNSSVAVARAIAGDPVICSPTSPPAIDSRAATRHALLHELSRNGATICMTHDPRYARHAQRSVHLFDGVVGKKRWSRQPPTPCRSQSPPAVNGRR